MQLISSNRFVIFNNLDEPDYLQLDLCDGCGQPQPKGIIATINHNADCPLNKYRYTRLTNRLLEQTLLRLFYCDEYEGDHSEGMDSIRKLGKNFTYLRAMPNFNTATDLEKKIYLMCRESDLRSMKRLRDYIQLEEEFNASY